MNPKTLQYIVGHSEIGVTLNTFGVYFLVLVGEGQEINTGENGGMVQWYNAIARSDKSWSVVCPDKLAEVFEGADVQTYDDLDLKVSIRSHTAGEVSNFVNKFIAGELDEAAALVEKIWNDCFVKGVRFIETWDASAGLGE